MLKLHLGCGWRNFGEGWIHIDGGNYPHLHSHDIINLPFEEGAVDLIYASHVFEYFDRETGKGVLEKWHMKLRLGGVLRLAVPDFDALIDLYRTGYRLEELLGPLYGKMRMDTDLIYHRTVYNYRDLAEMLKEVGFREVRKYNWRSTEHAAYDDHSQAYLPHMDKESGRLISLNVEATV